MRPAPYKSSRVLVPDHRGLTPEADHKPRREVVAPGSETLPGAARLHQKPQDLAGVRFGEWYVLSFAGSRTGRPRWRCRCSCGTERDVLAFQLTGGMSRSCGCRVKEHNTGTRRIAATRSEALRELIEYLERHVRNCESCAGSGVRRDTFEAFAVTQVNGAARVQSSPVGQAVRRDPCPDCGELRAAMKRVQELPA
jgi:hypothetical protein